MNPIDIYHEALRQGLRLEAAGDRIAVYPKCPADFAQVLREHKPELIKWLTTHHRKGWGAVPPDDLPLDMAMPRPTVSDRELVIGFALRQCHPAMLRWIVEREAAYFDGPGGRWDCALHAYAAARDLACWQLGINECEAIRFIQDMDDVAESMKGDRQPYAD